MGPDGTIFITKPQVELEKFFDPDLLMRSAPDYYGPKFDGIKALRDADDGTGHKGQEFRRVASFVNVPIMLAQKLANPEVLRDKKTFYALLDRYPQYLTYQRRNGGRMTAKDELKLPLSALGIDYPGGPETVEGWDAVDVPLADAGDNSAGPVTDPVVAP
jgi:hypothetical protein